jgi:hypothetical protein
MYLAFSIVLINNEKDIEKDTIQTDFIMLTKEEVEDMCNIHEEWKKNPSESPSLSSTSMKSLLERINALIQKYTNGAFVKLTCRSPKVLLILLI